MRPSNSFQPEEIAVLRKLCDAAIKDRSMLPIVRSIGFAGLYRKALAMQAKIDAHERDHVLEGP